MLKDISIHGPIWMGFDDLKHTLHTLNKLNWTSPTQLHEAFIGQARQHHDYFALIGCSKTRTVSARLVLNTCIPMRLFILEFANLRSVQFMCCEQAFTLWEVRSEASAGP